MKPITVNRFLLGWAVIVTIICIILFNVKSCGGISPQVTYKTDTVTTVIHDTIEKVVEVPKYVPKIIRITEPPKEVVDSAAKDSAACRQLAFDHYCSKEYSDTVGNDSIRLALQIYCSKNNVDSVKPKVILNIPYIQTVYQVIKTPIPKNPWKVYVGAGLGGSQSGFIGGGQILVTDPNRFFYSVGAYATTFSQPVFIGGFGMKISFRKK